MEMLGTLTKFAVRPIGSDAVWAQRGFGVVARSRAGLFENQNCVVQLVQAALSVAKRKIGRA